MTSATSQTKDTEFRLQVRRIFDDWVTYLRTKHADEWAKQVSSASTNANKLKSLQGSFKTVRRSTTLHARATACVSFLKQVGSKFDPPQLHDFDEQEFLKGPPTGAIRPKPSDSAALRSGPDPTPGVERSLVEYLSLLRDRIAKSEVAGDKKVERDLREIYAQCLRAVNRWPNAGDAFGQVAQMHLEVDDPVAAARIMLDQGGCYYRAEMFSQSTATLEQAAKLLEQTHPSHCDLRTELRLWELLGLALCRQGRHKEALRWLDHADKVSTQNKFSVPRSDASRSARRGVVLMEMERYDEAILALRTSVRMRSEQQTYPELERSLKYVALHHYTQGRLAESIAIWGVCLPQIAVVGDESEQASVQYYRRLALDAWSGSEGDSIGMEIDVARTIEGLQNPHEKAGALLLLSRHKPTPPVLRRRDIRSMVTILAAQINEIAQRRHLTGMLEKVSRFLPAKEATDYTDIPILPIPARKSG